MVNTPYFKLLKNWKAYHHQSIVASFGQHVGIDVDYIEERYFFNIQQSLEPTMETSSIARKIRSLRLTIEEKSESLHLLQSRIDEQRARNRCEIEQIEQEQKTLFQKVSDDNSNSLATLRSETEALTEKNKAMEARLHDLKETIAAAERDARKNAETVSKRIAETKHQALAAHKQRQLERERVWYEKRKSEMEKLTWKGMSPSIAQLLQKHDEAMHDIKFGLELSKEKLDIKFDNDLIERIQSLGGGLLKTSDISQKIKAAAADALSQEHNEQNKRLLKLKESFIQEEEMLKKSRDRDIETLVKEHETALAKVKLSMESKLQLEHSQHKTKMEQVRQRLNISLGDIDREMSATKEAWEKEYATLSNKRIAERNERNRKILMQRREAELKDIIRASFDQERRK